MAGGGGGGSSSFAAKGEGFGGGDCVAWEGLAFIRLFRQATFCMPTFGLKGRGPCGLDGEFSGSTEGVVFSATGTFRAPSARSAEYHASSRLEREGSALGFHRMGLGYFYTEGDEPLYSNPGGSSVQGPSEEPSSRQQALPAFVKENRPCGWEEIRSLSLAEYSQSEALLGDKIEAWRASLRDAARSSEGDRSTSSKVGEGGTEDEDSITIDSNVELAQSSERQHEAARERINALRAMRREMGLQRAQSEAAAADAASAREKHGRAELQMAAPFLPAVREAAQPASAALRPPEEAKVAPRVLGEIKPAPRPPVASTPAPVSASPTGTRSTALKRYDELERIARPILESADRIRKAEGAPMKTARMKLRININKRIGQIANSQRQVSSVATDLALMMNEAWSKSGMDLLNYCIVTMSEKVIEQAETQVCLHTPSAFPIAQVVLDVGIHQKMLIPVLVHLMMARCPYAVPRYVEREEGRTDQAHRLAMGYLLIEGNQIEGEQTYTERMAGMISLYGAIVQGEPTIGVANVYGIENGWVWLASILNIKPHPITPFVICAFLENAGYVMWRKYKDHFVKLMHFVRTQYLQMIPPGSVAAKTRMEIYIGAFFKKAQPSLCEPEGRHFPP